MLVQQPEEHQQHAAATATTSTSAVSASGHIRSAHRLHASRGHHYLQLPAATTTTTTTSASVSAGTTSITFYLSIFCDKSVHSDSTPGPHIYDINSINNMCGCGRRTTTKHRRTPSPLRHQPAESPTSSRSTSRVTSSLGNTM